MIKKAKCKEAVIWEAEKVGMMDILKKLFEAGGESIEI